MEKLVEERVRLQKQIEALQNELKGLDRAISLLGGGDETTGEGSARPRERGRNVKETVLTLVQQAGSKGVNVSEVLDNAQASGIRLERGSVSSLLSRLKREGVLEMDDGRYFVPMQTGGVPPTSH